MPCQTNDAADKVLVHQGCRPIIRLMGTRKISCFIMSGKKIAKAETLGNIILKSSIYSGRQISKAGSSGPGYLLSFQPHRIARARVGLDLPQLFFTDSL